PYHAYVPSFGDWGYVLATDPADGPLRWDRAAVGVPARFLTAERLPSLSVFDPDSSEVPTGISTLQAPVILRYYLDAWRHWRG
ncbi:MAG TPA: hypothetical protein VM536_04210, partial [Chloroflexia bacterium]|nr:hypothetical protein [Chloroflexia bacterium]